MKNNLILMVFLAILLVSCDNQKEVNTENPYIGAWEIISRTAVTADTTITYTSSLNPSVKLVTNKHYAFGRQRNDSTLSAGGGEYSYNDSSWISNLKYSSASAYVGKSYRWNSKIDGDLWTIYIDTLNQKTTEIWRRIPE